MFNKHKRDPHHSDGNDPRQFRVGEGQPPAALPLAVNINSNQTASGSRNAEPQNNPQHPDPIPLNQTLSTKRATWPGLQALKDVLRETTSAFEPLKVAVSGLAWCVEAFENEANARGEYKKLKNILDELLQDLSSYFGGATPPSMTPVIAALTQGIKEEIERVAEKQQRKRTQRYAEAEKDEDEVMECYRRIQTLLERLKLNANLSIWKIVDDETTVRFKQSAQQYRPWDLKDEQYRQDHRLKGLPYSPAAKYNSAESDSLHRTQCTPNTRLGVLQQLREWAHDDTSQRVYWLNGMAGTGKTTIAYSLCEHAKATGILAASFFCSRQLPMCRDVNRILPSISYQLSMFSRPFRHAISGILEKNPETHNQPLAKQFEELIAEPLRQVANTLPACLLIVIDALDECEDKGGIDRMLAALLVHVSNIPVKFFVTSRPEPEILEHMRSEQGERVQRELRLHELERSIVQEDIRTYLAAELDRVELSTPDLDKLTKRSGVLFIYAATVVRYIGYANFSRAAKRLKQVLGAPVASEHETSQEIDALYAAILEAGLDDVGLTKSEKDEMRLVLHTVVCAQEPLTVAGMVTLLGLDSADSALAALRPLSSVIQITEPGEVITTLHESFPNYILDKNRSKLFYCDQRQHHSRLVRCCIDLIKVPEPPFNICGLESSYLRDRDLPDLETRVRNAISQGLFYACLYWVAHLELAVDSANFFDDLHDFLSVRLLLWMEILNLKQRIYDGARVLYRLQTWLPGTECPHNLHQLAQDAWKFVTSFSSSPAAESTPHIYISWLPFWPVDRPISAYYLPKIQGLVKPMGTAMSRRNLAPLAVCTVNASVGCIACSPDNSVVVCGCEDGALYRWDIHTGQPVGAPLRGRVGKIISVAYSPDSLSIVSGYDCGAIFIWDTNTGKSMELSHQGYTTLQSVSYSPDGECITSTSAYVIQTWDVRTRQITRRQPIAGGQGHLGLVAHSPNGSYVITSLGEGLFDPRRDYAIRIWSTHTGQIHGRPLKGHTERITSLAYSPSGAQVVSGSDDHTIRIWDANTCQEIAMLLPDRDSNVSSIAYSSSGAYIVSGFDNGTIRIWDAHTRHMVGQQLKRHTDSVTSVLYSPCDAYIISVSLDKIICIWGASTCQTAQEPMEGHTFPVTAVAYSPDGAHIVTGASDGTICIWDAHTYRMLGQPLMGHQGRVTSIAYSPDSAFIVSSSSLFPASPFNPSWNDVRIWDARTKQLVGQLNPHYDQTAMLVAYSADGAYIITGSEDGSVCVWDAQTRQLVERPIDKDVDVASIVYSPSSGYVALSYFFKSPPVYIYNWGIQAGQAIGQRLEGYARTRTQFSPDGSCIVISDYCTLRIWDVRTGQALGPPLEGHSALVNTAMFSPDGARIISSSYDRTMRIWDAHTGKLIGRPLAIYSGTITSVACSPDGARIVSCSDDCIVRIWDAQNEQAVEDRISHTPPATRASHPTTIPSFPLEDSASGYKLAPWAPNEDVGWVVDSNNQPIIWVPPEVRDALLLPRNIALISPRGSLRLNFSNAKFGEQWAQCYYSD